MSRLQGSKTHDLKEVFFWGTETAFWLIWKTDLMRELGAVLGLSVGYIVKYNLDRKFVFTDSQMQGAT